MNKKDTSRRRRAQLRRFLESQELRLEASENYPRVAGLLNEAVAALYALDDGEVPPLFAPSKAKRRGPRPSEVIRLQCRALGYVSVLRWIKVPAEVAYLHVAGAYAVKDDTIKAWRKRLQKEFPSRLRLTRKTMVDFWRLFGGPVTAETAEQVVDRAKTDGKALKKVLTKKSQIKKKK